MKTIPPPAGYWSGSRPRMIDIEWFLSVNTSDFKDMHTHEMRRQWLIDNSEYAKRTAFKMANLGRVTWAAFIDKYALQEKLCLVPL